MIQQIRNLHNIGKGLHNAETQLVTMQKEIENKRIQIITYWIRENIKNERALIGRELTIPKKTMGRQRKRISNSKITTKYQKATIPDISNVATYRAQQEHYSKPSTPQYPNIYAQIWNDSRESLPGEIHPDMTRRRQNRDFGNTTAQYIYMETRPRNKWPV